VLTLNLSELILTVINFFVLLFLLKRFLYGPLIAFMDQRNARIQAALEQERAASAALEEEVTCCEQLRKEGREKAQQMIRDAKAEDEHHHAERVQEAYETAQSSRKELAAEEVLQNEKERDAVEEETERLATALARTLLGHFPDPPEMLVAQGLQVARERAEVTWESRKTETPAETRKKTADLFAAWDTVFDEDEPRKAQEQQDGEARNPDWASPLSYEHLFVRPDVLEQL
jgi:F-type H+-transporting ATPase subunit b